LKPAPSPFAPARFPQLPGVAGVRAATGSCGFYDGAVVPRDDVFLFAFAPETSCAGVFTRSTTASADIAWCRDGLARSEGRARALGVNAGNSNAFTGPAGTEKNAATIAAVTSALGVAHTQCFLAATGVIGEPLSDPDFVGAAIPDLAGRLAPPDWEACARAFMTTDTYPKGSGVRFDLDGVPGALAGIAKGSGMIAPNMATMLAYLFTDVAISPPLLDQALRRAVDKSFNSITVDGDTSTSDTVMVFATGQSDAMPIVSTDDPRLAGFADALETACLDMALQVVRDGEGASKTIKIDVEGAVSDPSARAIACAIANSPLVKTALAAGDANWGRIVMAVGKSMEPIDQDALSIWFGDHQVAQAGRRAQEYDEARASEICRGAEIAIRVAVGQGNGWARVHTCDLTHGYIDINGAYRT